jgi:methyltransferase-like protein/trans-aconitate methyltransferase
MNGNHDVAGTAVDDYDLLPYPSMPYAQTQPARLAAVAALYGLAAPPAARARVLELGCASGGNIIPLAARFPEARFLGVDLARRHVEEAQRRISALGLANIEVRQADLTHFSPGAEQYDYVICHGVFSWAPRAAQESVFRICRETLTNNGLAVVSYNVLPGWHMRSVIRDICLRHAGLEGSPQQRVVEARAILADIAATANAAEPYGLLLRNEARRTAHRPASYILGEFLVADNSPCYFQEFTERAKQHSLSYLCEADLEAAVPETLSAALQARISANAGADLAAREQYVDYFTGRTFRCSVLTKSDVSPARDWDHLHQLHIACDLRADPGKSDAETAAYTDARGRAVKSQDPAVARALARLAAARPATLSFAQVAAPPAGEASEPDAATRVCRALSILVAAGQAEISTMPLVVGAADENCPRVWALARAEAAAGQPWVTNLAHAPVAVKPAMAVLLAHLDGANTRERLAAIFVGALQRGEVKAPELQDDQPPVDSIEALALRYVERVLEYLAANALLAPGNDAPGRHNA